MTWRFGAGCSWQLSTVSIVGFVPLFPFLSYPPVYYRTPSPFFPIELRVILRAISELMVSRVCQSASTIGGAIGPSHSLGHKLGATYQ